MTSLPLISVRDIVFFPGLTLPLMIGRPFTLASINEAVEKFDGTLIITTQRAIEQNERPDKSQIFEMGCVCKVLKKIEFPDGAMKLLIEAQSRFQIKNLTDKNSVRYCEGRVVNDDTKSEALPAPVRDKILTRIQTKKSDFKPEVLASLKYLETVDNAHKFVMGIGQLLSLQGVVTKELSIEQIKEGTFIIDTLTDNEKSKINMHCARVQEVLEATTPHEALKKIEILLA